MVDLAAGAQLGPVVLEAELIAKLTDSINRHSDAVERYLRLQAAYQDVGPTFQPLRGTKTADSGGDSFVMGLGGPSPLRRWEVRNVVIGGLNWSSSVGGTALLIKTPNPQLVATAINLADVMDEAASLPSVAFYSSGQIVLRNPEHLHVVIVSPTGSTQYVAGGSAIDTPDIPARAVTDI